MPAPRSRRRTPDFDDTSSTRLLKMVWSHRLFLHWPVDPALLRAHVPEQLELDLREKHAWLGIAAFRLSGVRAILAPPMPGLSAFNEVNARVCVTYRGERGVYFFSADASSSVAVWSARTFLHLPYFRARIQATRRPESCRFASKRTPQGSRAATFDCAWTIGKPMSATRPGDLAHFLTERRQTFTLHRGRVYACHVDHEPWPLREARLTKFESTLFAAAGVPTPEGTPVAYHGDQLAVEMCSMKEVDRETAVAGLLDPAVAPPPASLSRS
jgi:uncharacterized protein YqjF (DUF2071 family)